MRRRCSSRLEHTGRDHASDLLAKLLIGRNAQKVAPFVPEETAERLQTLADALEQAAIAGDGAGAKAELDDALRPYAYLF